VPLSSVVVILVEGLAPPVSNSSENLGVWVSATLVNVRPLVTVVLYVFKQRKMETLSATREAVTLA